METTRTVLQKPGESDFQEVLRLKQDEDTRRHLGGPVTELAFLDHYKKIVHVQPPIIYWIVRQKDTDAFIGLVCIDTYHDGLHYEVSYELLPSFWGQGYGTEILESVIAYGFEQLGLEELYAETQVQNAGSVRLLEKIGMKRIRTLERFGEAQALYAIQKAG